MSLPRVDDGWPPRAGARGRRDDDDGRERRLPVALSRRSYEPAYAFARDGFATMETGHPRDVGVVDAPPPTTTTTTPATATATAWCAPSRARDVGFALARRSDGGETVGEMETRRLAGFDRRLDRRASETRDARRSSAETPTVDATRELVEMETTMGAPRAPEGVMGRLAALETSERATARELESVKAMLTDIMATQSNVLAALASQRSTDREDAVRGEAVERRRRGREKRRRARESERRDDARFGRDDDSAAIAIATDEDEGEMSESQLQKIVLRRMFMHQRGLNEESSQSA